MTPYEVTRSLLGPFLPPLEQLVRDWLRALAKEYGEGYSLLDVGGRRSPYTAGAPARVVVADLLREQGVLSGYDLGIDGEIARQTMARRSNVQGFVLQDMMRSAIVNSAFDCAVAVEVIEHVTDESQFVANIHSALRPGGSLLLTTPNADHPGRQGATAVKDERYFTKDDLTRLLGRFFGSVEVSYAVPVGRLHSLSLRPWSVKRPIRTIVTMLASHLNRRRDQQPHVRTMAIGTRELIAFCRRG